MARPPPVHTVASRVKSLHSFEQPALRFVVVRRQGRRTIFPGEEIRQVNASLKNDRTCRGGRGGIPVSHEYGRFRMAKTSYCGRKARFRGAKSPAGPISMRPLRAAASSLFRIGSFAKNFPRASGTCFWPNSTGCRTNRYASSTPAAFISAISARSAWPRWLIRFFSSVESSAIVFPREGIWKSGS